MNENSRIKQENISFTSQIPEILHKAAEPKQNETRTVKTTTTSKTHDHQCEEEEDVEGEIFGVILSRSRSVSSAASVHFPHESKAEKQQRGLKQSAAAMVAMSMHMKRSFSVSGGGYCRIHHQHDVISDVVANGENMNPNVFQHRTVKKKGKILKVCMRLLGL